MRFIVSVLALATASGLLPAFADPAPGTATATQATAATPTAPAAAQKPAAAAPAAAPAATPSPDLAAQEKHFIAEGYKVEMRNGEKYFCRTEEVLGSRLGSRQKTCSTAQQLTQTEHEAKAAVTRGQMQQTSPATR